MEIDLNRREFDKSDNIKRVVSQEKKADAAQPPRFCYVHVDYGYGNKMKFCEWKECVICIYEWQMYTGQPLCKNCVSSGLTTKCIPWLYIDILREYASP